MKAQFEFQMGQLELFRWVEWLYFSHGEVEVVEIFQDWEEIQEEELEWKEASEYIASCYDPA